MKMDRLIACMFEEAVSKNCRMTDITVTTSFVVFIVCQIETDFQYKKTRLEAPKLLEKSKHKLEEGGLLYIATDERDKSFFDPFKKHYEIVFLDDFKHLLTNVNTNYYGMLDQLVASKGRVFFGTWFSTLSGYVNRMRGYYIAKHKLEGYKDGTMESYYFYPVSLCTFSHLPFKLISCSQFTSLYFSRYRMTSTIK